MGCCHKKRKRNTLLKKSDDNNENDNEDADANSIIVRLKYDDFIPLKLLGRGSFGQVILARLKINDKLYAMKILDKSQLKLRHQEIHTQTERNLMVKIKCPFIVNIKSAFQEEKY